MKQLTLTNRLKDQDKPNQQRQSYAPGLFSSSRALAPYTSGSRTTQMTQSVKQQDAVQPGLRWQISETGLQLQWGKQTLTLSLQDMARELKRIVTTFPELHKHPYELIVLLLLGFSQWGRAQSADNSTSDRTTVADVMNLADAMMYFPNNTQSRIIVTSPGSCQYTMLNTLKLDNGAVRDLRAFVIWFERSMYYTERYCSKTKYYCDYINSCGMQFLNQASSPLQIGTPIIYHDTYYAGLFVGIRKDYPVGLLQCTDSVTQANKQCISQHIADTISLLQSSREDALGVALTYLFGVPLLLVLVGILACRINMYRTQARENQIQKATELTSLIATPRSTLTPVTASTDHDLEAQVAEMHAQEQAAANPGCLQRLLRR